MGELLRSAPELVRMVFAADDAAVFPLPPGCEAVKCGPGELAELSGTVTPQGIIAVAAVPEPPEGRPRDRFLLALDRIGDPGNFGTICRTARAVGLTEIWYTAGTVDPFGDKAVRSAMGAQFALGMRRFQDLEALRNAAAEFGYGNFIITDPHGGESCFDAPDLFDRSVLVTGGEPNGATMLENARHINIPMPGGYESLNAAQAATVILFEYVRRSITEGNG